MANEPVPSPASLLRLDWSTEAPLKAVKLHMNDKLMQMRFFHILNFSALCVAAAGAIRGLDELLAAKVYWISS